MEEAKEKQSSGGEAEGEETKAMESKKETEEKQEQQEEARQESSVLPEEFKNLASPPDAAAAIEEEFVILEIEGRRRSTSYIDPSEAVDFWKVHNESFMSIQRWVEQRTRKTEELRDLTQCTIECLLLFMSRINANNQGLMTHFNLVASNAKELMRNISKMPLSLEPIIAHRTISGKQQGELFKKLKSADVGFANNLRVFAAGIDQELLPQIKGMTVEYAKSLAALKDAKPMFGRSVEEASKKLGEIIKVYYQAFTDKEAYVLKLRVDDVDIWLAERQLVFAEKVVSAALQKLVDFEGKILDEARRLERLKRDCECSVMEKYAKMHSAAFGPDGALSPSISNLDAETQKEGAVLMESLFSEDAEMKRFQKMFNVSPAKYRKMGLEELQTLLRGEASSLRECPESMLEERRCSCKRVSGLFSTWIPCTLITTKDKYLHIFDMEHDVKPVFTFDIIRTQGRRDDSESLVFEMVETKKRRVMGTEATSKSQKLMMHAEEDVLVWIDYINSTQKK